MFLEMFCSLQMFPNESPGHFSMKCRTRRFEFLIERHFQLEQTWRKSRWSTENFDSKFRQSHPNFSNFSHGFLELWKQILQWAAREFFLPREWVFLYSNKSDISSPLYTQHFTLQDHLVMDEEVGEEADKEVKEVTNGEWAFLYSNKPNIHLTLQDLNSHNIDIVSQWDYSEEFQHWRT